MPMTKSKKSPKNNPVSIESPKKKTKNFPSLRFISISTTIIIFLGMIIIALVTSLVALHFMFIDRIYPGILVAQTDVAGLTKTQALQKLTNQTQNRTNQKISFNYLDSNSEIQKIDFNLRGIEQNLNYSQAVDQAFEYGHSKLYFPPLNINLNFEKKLDQNLKPLTDEVNKEPIDSEIKVVGNETVVTPSQQGYVLDKDQFSKTIWQYLNQGRVANNFLPMKKVESKVDFTLASRIKKRLDLNKTSPLTLNYRESSASAQKQTFTIDFATLVSLLDLQQDDYLNQTKLQDYLKDIATGIDRPVQEPLFNFDPNSKSKVTEFSPPVTGKKLDQLKTAKLLSQALLDQSIKEITLPVETIDPKNKLTNDMGIKELIGQGQSSFEGSINNRIYNLKLATTRLNGVLVAPGETFSFLDTMGKIDASTGYKQAYVIKSGKTVLDDGGGVCQVSTTLFRTVLNSGLPVLERTAHAYRVGYYELGGYPPGFDATIFNPGVDFKFKNDTGHHVLIQAYSEGNNLYVNFYGTSDGRVAEVSRPVITNRTPPPPDLRQDDPNLKKGEVQQTEHAIEGANVVFSRKVTRDGQVLINENFKSNFRPWQAVYLVGTKEG